MSQRATVAFQDHTQKEQWSANSIDLIDDWRYPMICKSHHGHGHNEGGFTGGVPALLDGDDMVVNDQEAISISYSGHLLDDQRLMWGHDVSESRGRNERGR